MKIHQREINITIHPSFWILLAFSLLSIPLSWIIAWILAMFIHEISHFLCLRLCRLPVFGIDVTCAGVLLNTECSGIKAILCALAGPVGGLLLLLLTRLFPKVAICAFTQSASNLLPIYPLDGGQVLRNSLQLFLPEKNAKIITNLISGLAISIILLSVIKLPKPLQTVPVILAIALLFRSGIIKIPCKERKMQVQ